MRRDCPTSRTNRRAPSRTGPVFSRAWPGLHRAAALHDTSIVFVLAFHGITTTGYTRLVSLPAGQIAGLDRSGHGHRAAAGQREHSTGDHFPESTHRHHSLISLVSPGQATIALHTGRRVKAAAARRSVAADPAHAAARPAHPGCATAGSGNCRARPAGCAAARRTRHRPRQDGSSASERGHGALPGGAAADARHRKLTRS